MVRALAPTQIHLMGDQEIIGFQLGIRTVHLPEKWDCIPQKTSHHLMKHYKSI